MPMNHNDQPHKILLKVSCGIHILLSTNSCLSEVKAHSLGGKKPRQLPGYDEVMDLRGETITATLLSQYNP